MCGDKENFQSPLGTTFFRHGRGGGGRGGFPLCVERRTRSSSGLWPSSCSSSSSHTVLLPQSHTAVEPSRDLVGMGPVKVVERSRLKR